MITIHTYEAQPFPGPAPALCYMGCIFEPAHEEEALCKEPSCPWCQDSSCAEGPAEGIFEILSSRASAL